MIFLIFSSLNFNLGPLSSFKRSGVDEGEGLEAKDDESEDDDEDDDESVEISEDDDDDDPQEDSDSTSDSGEDWGLAGLT